MRDRRAYAKRLMLHYFSLVADTPLSGDCRSEIEGMVDAIIDAAKEELVAELAVEPEASD